MLGLAESPWLVSASGLVGPDVMTRTILPIEGQPRGLLLPADGRGLKREDLAAIPDDATFGLALRLDVQKAIGALVAAAQKADPQVKQSLLKALEPLRAGGSDSRQSIFAPLGDRWCFYNSPREGGLVLTGLTGVVPITDRKQFSRNYEVLMRLATGGAAFRRVSRTRPRRIRRFRFAGSDIHYANLGEFGLAPAWWAGDNQLVAALAPRTSRPISRAPTAAVPWPTCRQWPTNCRAAIRSWRSAISTPRGCSKRSIRCCSLRVQPTWGPTG